MDQRLRVLAANQGGVFTREQALVHSYTDHSIAALVRGKHLHRMRRGIYMEASHWVTLDEPGRHRAQVHAVCLRCRDDLVVSHTSAAVLRAWPMWEASLDGVWVTRASERTSRTQAGVRHHVAELPESESTVVDGIRVTSPERTMVDFARYASFESAVVTLDAALRCGADRDLAREISLRYATWPLARRSLAAVNFADGRSESPLESRTRVFCHLHGLPPPTPQVPIAGHDGQIFARVDLVLMDEWVGIECDGRVKYVTEPGRPESRDTLFQEKRREDRLREEAGLEVVRIVHRDLDFPKRTVARIQAAIDRAAHRRRAAA